MMKISRKWGVTNVMEICSDLSSKIKSSFIMTLFKQFADKNDVVIC